VERILLNRHPDVCEERLLCMLAIVIKILACIFMFWVACFESLPKYYFKILILFFRRCVQKLVYISPPPLWRNSL